MHGQLAQHLRSSSPKGHPPNPRGTWGNLVETRGGVGKSGVLEHKSGNISKTRKDRENITMEGLQEITNALSNGTIPDPLWPPLPQDWGFATPPKTSMLLHQERLKLRTSNLASTFRGSIRTKAHLKFWRKGSVAISRDCPIFLLPPIISGMDKARNFKFCTHIHRIVRNKSPLKISWKVAMGVLRDSRIFRALIYRAHCAVIFATAQFSCYCYHYEENIKNYRQQFKEHFSCSDVWFVWHRNKTGVKLHGSGNYCRVRRPNVCQYGAMHQVCVTSSYRTRITLISAISIVSTAAAAAVLWWQWSYNSHMN